LSRASWKRPEERADGGGAIDQFVAVVLGAEDVGERVGGLVVVLEGSVERCDVQRDVGVERLRDLLGVQAGRTHEIAHAR
jgi:hypothetical protein